MRALLPGHRRLDAASLALLLVGLVCLCLSYWLITAHDLNPLILIPSVVATTTGASHLTKREAARGGSVDLAKIEPNPHFKGETAPALVACLHPPGCWSYCTGGYRYCLCCMKVRVRC